MKPVLEGFRQVEVKVPVVSVPMLECLYLTRAMAGLQYFIEVRLWRSQFRNADSLPLALGFRLFSESDADPVVRLLQGRQPDFQTDDCRE